MESSKILFTIIIFLIGTILLATGIVDEDTVREFDYYSDTYSFGASAKGGWEILSASANGGGSGHWIAAPPATNDDGSKNYPRGSVSAYGTRVAGANSSNMFSATLSGSIRPIGSDGSPRTYSYRVRAAFKGELSIKPTSQTAPLGGGAPESYRLFSTYDGVAHHISGYWRTTPNRAGENGVVDYMRHWASYYGGETRWPGELTVEGSAHADGGDLKSAVLRVVGVSSITATTAENASKTSSTDGIKRNAYQEAEKDSSGNHIPEEIPTLFTKQAETVTLSAAPTPGTPWPVYSSENNQNYPVWSISGTSSQSDYLTLIYGASSATKPAKGFGTIRANASCGNQKSIFLKFIRVKFAKKNIYASWDIHNEHNVSQYLAGKSSLMGCTNPSACTDLQCNHRGVYDEAHFSWSVSGDAELVLTQNNQTVYATSFSPAAEKDKPAETKKYFTGKIRFTKPGITTESNITVTAASEELTSEADSLTIIPQYINLSVAGVPEEEYAIDTDGTVKLSNPRNAESTAGAFIPINDNDNNQDRNSDRNKTTETTGTDPDLIEVAINKKIDGTIDGNHPVVLSLSHANGGRSGIKVWKDITRSELLIDGAGSWNFTTAGSVPTSVFVEAIGSTSANLTMSHSFTVNTDPAATNWYTSNVSDLIRLEGFGVDIAVSGLQNESTVNDANDNAIRTLVHEEFPGGEICISPASGWTTVKIDTEEQPRSIYLIPVTLTGNNLIRNAANMQLEQDETHPDLDREITLTYTSDKVEFYERVKNADGSDKVDSDNNPVYKKLSEITRTVADLPQTVYLRPLKDSGSKRDVGLKLSYTSPQNGATHEDSVKLTLLHLDVDVDSNNDGTVAVDDETEDETELYASIMINSGDKDNDGIADNIDFEIAGADNVFKEMKIRLPKSVDLDNCKIKISYGAAALPDANGNFTSGGSQSLRIWRKQSNQLRTEEDYIAPTIEDDPSTPDVNEETFYTPTDLMGEGNREVSLWVESVCEASNYNAQITVTIVPVTPKEISASTAIPADEATIPETYNLSDTVGFSTLGINLTFPNPIPATPVVGTTPASRGYDTILVSNIADESSDAKRPDYANFEARNDTSLLQLNMTVSTANLGKENFKIKFEYDGVAQLDDLARTEITGTALKDIFMRGSKQYYDYTPFKKGVMRVWASSKQVENAGAWGSTKVITATSARDKGKYGIGTGNYFAPANSPENAYLLSDLFPSSTSSDFTMTFWVEGINPNDKTLIKATLLYNDDNSWQEVAASFVNVKVLEARMILNTNNDKDYTLDDDDHKIKDQHDGFQGWFAKEFASRTRGGSSANDDVTSTHGLENLFSAKVELPKLPDANMVYSVFSDADVLIEKPNGAEGLKYLTENHKDAILSKISSAQESPYFNAVNHPELLTQKLDKELLFGMYGSSSNVTEKAYLLLSEETGNPYSKTIVLDSALVTFRPIDKYFWMGTCRTLENNATAYKNDPGKDDSTVIQYGNVMPCSGWNAFSESPMLDSNKPFFVYLHGFIANENDAINANRIIFRRLYWTGYRGNHTSLTWNGNSLGVDVYNFYDDNMENALLSGKAIKNFLSSLGSDPSKRHIAAHSLGNLAMWEALRQHSLTNQNSKLVNNAISIQAAVWEEVFWTQAPLTYQKQEYTLGIPHSETVTDLYNVDRLINNSWTFWFNQGANGIYAAKNAAMRTVNSYTDNDDYLNGSSIFSMKRNDFYSTKDYYNRDSTAHRTHSSLPNKAAMFKSGEIVRSGLFSLAIPLNAFTDPFGVVDSEYFSIKIKANSEKNGRPEYGWENDGHFQHTNAALYDIYKWYNAVFQNLN